ncbi:hypothetical protein H6P81_016645 [Aristolochia fimbriata]|uniref:Uncharacterized protein n=1 Tax=Aristolochia fimbriata TaxID=158543 RepID=A0AAV7E8V0_ARIFI|nr:hypothetical protein H6P81_016645 [Aristolochia fimbriata]
MITSGCWTPIICFEIIEMHIPDRVMLLFGLEQIQHAPDQLDMIYQTRGYIEETLLGCVWNVIDHLERVDLRDGMWEDQAAHVVSYSLYLTILLLEETCLCWILPKDEKSKGLFIVPGVSLQ